MKVDQIAMEEQMSDQHAKPPITTTDAGAPASSDEYSLTVGPGGPNLLQDSYLNEKLAHFVRERSPPRLSGTKHLDQRQ